MTRSITKTALSAVIAVAALTTLAGNASALSLSVKLACATDYYKHCSAFSPGGSEVRQCMRNAGAGLSKSCVSALISAGEVTQAEVDRRRAASQTAAR